LFTKTTRLHFPSTKPTHKPPPSRNRGRLLIGYNKLVTAAMKYKLPISQFSRTPLPMKASSIHTTTNFPPKPANSTDSSPPLKIWDWKSNIFRTQRPTTTSTPSRKLLTRWKISGKLAVFKKRCGRMPSRKLQFQVPN
jgi:hypothetical protein